MSEDNTPDAPQAPDKPTQQRPVQTAAQVFAYDSHAVRTVQGDDGEVWFVATDVLSALELNRSSLDRVDDDEKGVQTVYTLGGPQSLTVLNESGLYNLVLTSRKPAARQFKKWITAEVLPSIRRTGGYSAAGQADMAVLAGAVAALVARQDMMERKVDAILDLVDVTKRYVHVLETNQKKAPRTEPYAKITPALEAEVLHQLAQGFSVRDVGRAVNLPPTAVHRIKTTAAAQAATTSGALQ